MNPTVADEWDDLLVEYKNSSHDITKSKFETLVASVEFMFPRFRGKLSWAHAVVAGWSFSQDINHTKPLTRAPAALFAVMMSSAGHPRAGAALVVQQSRGLRAIEVLALCPEHVMFSASLADSADKPKTATVRLGAKRGTKVKREQFVIFREAQQPDAYKLLECIVANTAPGERLFPLSHWTYRRLISDAECKLGLEVGFTPHSARAGFATEAVASGESFETKFAMLAVGSQKNLSEYMLMS
jgi:hypothetical protein